jgi:hypothetical protein
MRPATCTTETVVLQGWVGPSLLPGVKVTGTVSAFEVCAKLGGFTGGPLPRRSTPSAGGPGRPFMACLDLAIVVVYVHLYRGEIRKISVGRVSLWRVGGRGPEFARSTFPNGSLGARG